MRRSLIVSTLLAAVCAASAWWFWPDDDLLPVATRTASGEARPRRAKRADVARPERPIERKHAKRRPPDAPAIAPDEKAKVRSEFREERVLALDEQLDAYAEEAGWDPDLTESVRSILVETIDHIGTELAQVDAGAEEWEVLRPELRQYRLEQAAEIEHLLGKDFDRFTEAMAFGRFLGERPPGRERFEPFLTP